MIVIFTETTMLCLKGRAVVIRLSIRQLVKRPIFFWLVILFMTIVLVLFECTAFFWHYMDLFRLRVESTFGKDIIQIGVYYVEEYPESPEEERGFYSKLSDSGMIEAIGTISVGGSDYFPDLVDAQNRLPGEDPERKYYPRSFWMARYATVSILKLIGIQTVSGKEVDEERVCEIEENGDMAILLGYNFRDYYKEGDIIESPNGSHKGYILGILEKDSAMLDFEMCFGSGDEYLLNSDPKFSLDNSIVILDSMPEGSPGVFITKDGVDCKDINEYMESIQADYNIRIKTSGMDEHLGMVAGERMPQRETFTSVFIIVGIICIIIMVNLQYYLSKKENYDYGIFLINGMKMSGVCFIAMIDMIIRFLIAFLLSLGISFFVLRIVIGTDSNESLIHMVMIKYTYLQAFVIGLFILFLSNAVPMIKLLKKQEKDLLNELRE